MAFILGLVPATEESGHGANQCYKVLTLSPSPLSPAGSRLELPRCILLHVVRGDKKDARYSLVVTFAANRLQGPMFKP